VDVPLAVTNGNNNDICSSANLAKRSYPLMLLLNATGLRKPNALQHLATELRQTNSGFGFIVETWFKSVDNDGLFSISDYILFRRDRVCVRRKHGGGVCIYVKSGIDCFVMSPCPTADTNIEILRLHLCFSEYIFGLCYHPPDAPYVTEFIDCISNSVDVLTSLYPGAVLCVLGDFNQLDTTFLQCEFGLSQIVDTPTLGNNLLDKVFINVPDGYQTQVFKILVKTKHQTVLVVHYGVPYCVSNKPQKSTLYDLRSHNVDLLRYCIGTFDWSIVFFCQNLQAKYVYFSTALGPQSTAAFLARLLDEVKGIQTILHRLLSHYYVNDPSYANMVILRRPVLYQRKSVIPFVLTVVIEWPI